MLPLPLPLIPHSKPGIPSSSDPHTHQADNISELIGPDRGGIREWWGLQENGATLRLKRTILPLITAIKEYSSMFPHPEFSTQPKKSGFLYEISQFSNVGLSFLRSTMWATNKVLLWAGCPHVVTFAYAICPQDAGRCL